MTSRLSKRASQMLNKPPARSMAAIANVPINVPYIEDADTGTYRMEGCIHLIRNAYVKNSAREFIRMLGESTAVMRNKM